MRLLEILPPRLRSLVPELTRFAAIGVINTLTDVGIYNALLSIGAVKAKVIATIVGTTVSYVLNRYWTFAKRQRSSAHREYTLFFALNMVGLVIQSTPIAFAKYGLHYSDTSPALADWLAFNIANFIGIGIGMVFRFWSYRKWVFTAPAEELGVIADTVAAAGTIEVVPTVAQIHDGPDATPDTASAQDTVTAPDATDAEFAELTERLDAADLEAANLEAADLHAAELEAAVDNGGKSNGRALLPGERARH